MSGKPGQQTTKAIEVGSRYDENFVSELDGRYRTAKTLRQRLRELTNDLGGLPGLSYQERSLCKRAIHLERVVEKFESTLAHGGSVEFNHYFGLVNTLSGLWSKLGMKRRAKVVRDLAMELKEQLTHDAQPQVE